MKKCKTCNQDITIYKGFNLPSSEWEEICPSGCLLTLRNTLSFSKMEAEAELFFIGADGNKVQLTNRGLTGLASWLPETNQLEDDSFFGGIDIRVNSDLIDWKREYLGCWSISDSPDDASEPE